MQMGPGAGKGCVLLPDPYLSNTVGAGILCCEMPCQIFLPRTGDKKISGEERGGWRRLTRSPSGRCPQRLSIWTAL